MRSAGTRRSAALSLRTFARQKYTRRSKVRAVATVELLVLLDTSPEYRDVPGAVLVFLPGLAHIQQLHDTLRADQRFADSKRLVDVKAPRRYITSL